MTTWSTAAQIIRAEAGPEVAKRIESRLRVELAGERVSIPALGRVVVTDDELRKTLRECSWNVDKAAAKLGLNRVTVYRRLKPKRSRVQVEIDAFLGGRLVR